MTWNGKGFNKPLIMLNWKSPVEAMLNNAYEPDPEVAAMISDNMTSEQLISLLSCKGMLKEACDYIAFAINRRVGTWWAYSCVKAVNKEIKEQKEKCPLTFEELQKKEIKERLSEWKDKTIMNSLKDTYRSSGDKTAAKMEKLAGPDIDDPEDPLAKLQTEYKSVLEENSLGFAIEEINAAINSFPPEEVKLANEIVEKNLADREKISGIHPLEAIKKEIIASIAPETATEDSTLRDQYYGMVKEKIARAKQFADKKMKEHFPLKLSGLPKNLPLERTDEILFAVKRWILTPTDENGKIALGLANKAGSGPEKLCALTAYWSSSDLTPDQKNHVAPPPGLASNGIMNTIFMCALKKGGSKSYDERYEEYFRLGIECLAGICTWDKEWAESRTGTIKYDCRKALDAKSGFGRE
ncbi:hypothetical protein P0136_09295 [Lentisphaerota bacterium ZTH]|nr:hypothetical protein JYG24_13195 [Lentisphaerota bacterium]WET05558.1 hypothetical protein P0136_09295 [Lentisphaerota bacterium ZTH]